MVGVECRDIISMMLRSNLLLSNVNLPVYVREPGLTSSDSVTLVGSILEAKLLRQEQRLGF